MLVPVILHMDSVSTDQRGKLSLTPLNMTLGIFSTWARKQPEAWETLHFHPDNSFMSSKQFRKTPSASSAAKHNIINLHSGLCVALASLKMAIDGNGLLCHNFPWAGKKWSVQMKFSIAFVIGDTELHNKLCTQHGARSSTIKSTCRHCNCPTNHLTDVDKQAQCHL